MRSSVVRAVRLLIAVAAVAACSDSSTGPGTQSSKNVRYVAGFDGVDTALARPIQSLLVEIHDGSGAPMPGTVVRFEGTPDTGAYPPPTMFVAPLSSTYFGGVAFDTTNSQGRASVLVQFGLHAGTGRVVITVPDLGVQDTALYTVQPGKAFGVRAMPKDTSVYASGAIQLRSAVVDAHGNPRNDPVTYQAGVFLSLGASGHVTAGSTFSRTFVVVSANGLVDTSWISIVPTGTIAAYRFQDTTGIVLANLDGSGYKLLATATPSTVEATPTWANDGSKIIYATGNPMQLRSVTPAGVSTPFLVNPPGTLLEALWPQFTNNGAYVFFSGRIAGQNFAIWRANADGTGAARVGRDVGAGGIDWRASPNNDGSLVAFVTAGSGGAEIHTMDMSTLAVSPWSVIGQSPHFDRQGYYIALTQSYGGPIRRTSIGGVTPTQLTPVSRWYSETAMDWSPDNKWVIARGPEELELINVQTGLTLPLGWSRTLSSPAWKP